MKRAAVLAFLVYGMSAAMLGTLLPELSRRFGFSDGQNGTIALARSVGLIAASVSAGPLVDRKGARLGVMLGFAVLAVGLAGLSLAAEYGSVCGAMLAVGLGGGVVVTGANALAAGLDPGRRAATLTVLNLFFGVGGFLTPLLASAVFAGREMGLCRLVAGLSAGSALVYWRMPEPRREGGASFRWAEARKLLGTLRLAFFCALLFLYVACEVSVWDWLPKYLVVRGMDERAALRTVSFGFALGMLAGRAGAGWLLRRVEPGRVTLPCAAAIAVCTFGLMRVGNAAGEGVLAFCAGAAMAPVFPATLGRIADEFAGMSATAMGMAITCGWVGLALVSKLIGAVGLPGGMAILPCLGVLMLLLQLGEGKRLAAGRNKPASM